MKNIWIINEYAGTPYHGMEFRHYYLAKNFIKLGYQVTIISASFSHLFKSFPDNSRQFNFEKIDEIDYVWIKVPQYTSSKDKIRVIKWFIYCLKLYFLPLKKIQRPDTIIMSSAAPFAIFPSFYFSKKFKAKLIFEVKDIWPLSLINIGGFSKTHPFIKLMSFAEKKAIQECDFLVSNLPNYKKHIENLGFNKSVYWLPNGIEYSKSEKTPLKENIKDKIPKNKFIVGYTGTVGQANALDYFIKSAILLKDVKEICLIIVGNGSMKEKLIEICKNNNLHNVIFIDAIDKKEIPSMLECFDICYIGWNDEVLYEYGIAANKIFDYMLSGKPILHSFNGNGDIIQIANCGITVEAGSAEKIAKAILEYSSMTKIDLTLLGENGKKYVLENFTYTKIAEKYNKLLSN